jgi:hypothetical protein
VTGIEERVAVLETKDEARDKADIDHAEFRKEVRAALGLLLTRSNEWSGVRKTLAAIAAIITFTSGIVGFALHEFWPHVINGKS